MFLISIFPNGNLKFEAVANSRWPAMLINLIGLDVVLAIL